MTWLVMASIHAIVGCLLCGVACSPSAVSQRPPVSGTVNLFEGARLINGSGNAPIENSAFIVDGDKFSRVGKKGEPQAPAGAVRIDLAPRVSAWQAGRPGEVEVCLRQGDGGQGPSARWHELLTVSRKRIEETQCPEHLR